MSKSVLAFVRPQLRTAVRVWRERRDATTVRGALDALEAAADERHDHGALALVLSSRALLRACAHAQLDEADAELRDALDQLDACARTARRVAPLPPLADPTSLAQLSAQAQLVDELQASRSAAEAPVAAGDDDVARDNDDNNDDELLESSHVDDDRLWLYSRVHWNVALFAQRVECDFDRAETHYAEALRVRPTSWPLRTAHARLFIDRGGGQSDYERAERLLRDVIAKEPTQPDALLWLAFCTENVHRQFDAAEALYEQVLALDPNNPEMLGNFAAFLVDKRHDYARADELRERLFRLQENHVKAPHIA